MHSVRVVRLTRQSLCPVYAISKFLDEVSLRKEPDATIPANIRMSIDLKLTHSFCTRHSTPVATKSSSVRSAATQQRRSRTSVTRTRPAKSSQSTTSERVPRSVALFPLAAVLRPSVTGRQSASCDAWHGWDGGRGDCSVEYPSLPRHADAAVSYSQRAAEIKN